MVNNLSFVALRVSSPEYSEDTPGYCSANQQLIRTCGRNASILPANKMTFGVIMMQLGSKRNQNVGRRFAVEGSSRKWFHHPRPT
jgi:hypothetical protein